MRAQTNPPGREPIAIVGIGCRLPGASSVGELWNVLDSGADTVGEYPGGRFPFIDAVYAGDYPEAAVATRAGGFLPDVDKFDAGFFGISAREAAFLDPQHRLFFETAWEAMEDSGTSRASLAGTQTAVFAGLWCSDYETCIRENAPEADFFSTTGSGRYSLSGRLSYMFDLRGPSLTVDSGCSASLAAIQLGCRSIQAGDAEMALCGGSNVILRPDITVAYSAAGMLSTQGRCRFGDADASGYVRSEGAAVVVLKPLGRAIADGDRIYAVIRGGAVNNDGRSSGLLISPSGPAQTNLIRSALVDAGVAPASVQYVEAHGTGTVVGDPVEIEAIGTALASTDRVQPVLVGSIKTNIGHTESTAGVAGLIKVALSLYHGRIPKSLHYRTPNPRIAWDSVGVKLASEASQWNGDGPHFAAVSSFGITGTNACVVLESAPENPAHAAAPADIHLLTVSANSDAALRESAGRWQKFLKGASKEDLSNICYSAARRRTHQEYRLAVAGADADAIAEVLGDAAAVRVREVQKWKLAFVFSPVGGQRSGMGMSLMQANPVFRQSFIECADAIQRHGGPDILTEIQAPPESSRLADAEIAQPALWAFQTATVKLWESLGILAQAVMGHSMGEVSAAVACGALSVDEGASIVCRRSRLSKKVSRPGAMAMAAASAEVAGDVIAAFKDRIWIAGVNGARSTVLSGEPLAVEEAIAEFQRREIFCRPINSDVASHCPYMDEVRAALESGLGSVNPQRTGVEFYSTSTGRLEEGSALGAAYWGNNLRQPVLFWPTFKRMLDSGYNAFVEIGPHPVLLQSMTETIGETEREGVVAASNHRDFDDRIRTLTAIGELHAAGYPVDFSKLYPTGRCVSLPTYAWQRERHWLETRAAIKPAESASDHLYELRWRRIPAPAGAIIGARRVLLLGGGHNAETLRNELRNAGCEVILTNEDQSLDAILGGPHPITDVVHMRPADIEPEADLDLAGLWTAQKSGLLSLIRTVQLLAAYQGDSAPRLWSMTSGALPVEHQNGRLRIEQSPIAGLAGAIRREHPELQCRHLDVGAADLQLAARLISLGTDEETIAIRDGLWAPRYERSSPIARSAPVLEKNATYLVTGGAGGVGMSVAAWMAERGAGNIVLTGRHVPSPEGEKRINGLRASGVEVRVITADLTSDADTSALIAAMAGMPALRGIFHAAAVADDALLMTATPEQVSRVLAPKMAGAWNLHRHTAGLPLDFFILCSSMAVPMTQPGQAAYAAANSFLDVFAAYRRNLGLPATSIQWGVWADIGVALNEGAQRNSADWVSRGVRPLTERLGLEMLGAAMTSDAACVLAAPVAWKKFADSCASERPAKIFASLIPAKSETEQPSLAAQSFSTHLEGLKPADRLQAVREHLLDQLALVLKTSASRIDIQKPLGSLGVDSLLSLELTRRLSASTGVKLPATIVFNYPTVKALAIEIARRMGAVMEAPPVEAAPPTNSPKEPESGLAECSEEEAILALMAPAERGGP